MEILDDDDRDGSGKGAKGKGKRDYEVGYGKTPVHTRFRKGQSGNPRGPQKGSRGLRKDLHKALNAKHSIKVSGKVVTGTTQELAMYTLATRAAAGDIRATRQLAELVMQIFGPEDRGRERNALSQQDQELLERLLDRLGPEDGEGEKRDDGRAGSADDGSGGGPTGKGRSEDEAGDTEPRDEA